MIVLCTTLCADVSIIVSRPCLIRQLMGRRWRNMLGYFWGFNMKYIKCWCKTGQAMQLDVVIDHLRMFQLWGCGSPLPRIPKLEKDTQPFVQRLRNEPGKSAPWPAPPPSTDGFLVESRRRSWIKRYVYSGASRQMTNGIAKTKNYKAFDRQRRFGLHSMRWAWEPDNFLNMRRGP